MRSAEIAEVLVAGGFPAQDRDMRDFSNTIFSAMHRRNDIFTKVGRGLWLVRGMVFSGISVRDILEAEDGMEAEE